MKVWIEGQQIRLFVDSACVLEDVLPVPVDGDQVGLYAWGTAKVTFEDFRVVAAKPRAFIVMQFGRAYDSLWREVIGPTARRAGFNPKRTDDIFGPGVVLKDIVQGIAENDVVIAEITPSQSGGFNPNVFYELGYAHALRKPTILLANAARKDLPFDTRGYRVEFYKDTAGGRHKLAAALFRHLKAVGLLSDSEL